MTFKFNNEKILNELGDTIGFFFLSYGKDKGSDYLKSVKVQDVDYNTRFVLEADLMTFGNSPGISYDWKKRLESEVLRNYTEYFVVTPELEITPKSPFNNKKCSAKGKTQKTDI